MWYKGNWFHMWQVNYLLFGFNLKATAVLSLRCCLYLDSSSARATALSYIFVSLSQSIWCNLRKRYQLLLPMKSVYASSGSLERACMGTLTLDSLLLVVEDVFGDAGVLLLLACKPLNDETVVADWELLHAATFTSSFSSVAKRKRIQEIHTCNIYYIPRYIRFYKIKKIYHLRPFRHRWVLDGDGKKDQV